MDGSISHRCLIPSGVTQGLGQGQLDRDVCWEANPDAWAEETTAKKPNAAAGHHGSVLMELDFLLPFLLEL